jgi:hypothetical protein
MNPHPGGTIATTTYQIHTCWTEIKPGRPMVGAARMLLRTGAWSILKSATSRPRCVATRLHDAWMV